MNIEVEIYEKKRISDKLKGHGSINVTVLESVDSTNSYAKREILSSRMEKTSLILANTQTGGRGRMGRSFYSPPENGIYMSLCYRTNSPFCDVVSITSSSAVAVMRAIKKHTGIQTGIKWVNDLYHNQKKVCGILAEAIPDRENNGHTYVIVGVGINLHKGDFPPELRDIAGALDADCSKNDLVADITNNLLFFAKSPGDRSFMEEYCTNSIVIGKEVKCIKGDMTIEGKAISITDSGALVVLQKDMNEITIDSGEVSLRFI